MSSLMRPVLRPLIRGMVEPAVGSAPLCYALTFDGIDDYGTFDSPLALIGDFEVEIGVILSPGTLSTNRFFGTLTGVTGRAFARVTDLGSFQFGLFGTTTDAITLSALVLVPGVFYHFAVSRVGSTLMIMEMVSGAATTVPGYTTEDGVINVVGRHMTNYLKGQILFFKSQGVTWPLSVKGSAIQPSIPVGNSMTLFNTTPEQWEEIPCNLRP